MPSERLGGLVTGIAEVVAGEEQATDSALVTLLADAGLGEDAAALDLARQWLALLTGVRQSAEAARALGFGALVMAGLPEADARRAVETVAGGAAAGAPAPLSVAVERLDLGAAAAGEPARGTFQVSGGPGRILPGDPRLVVTPAQFGPGPTQVQIEVAGLPGAVLLTSLQLVTPAEVADVPVFARWTAAGVAAPAASVRDGIPAATPAAPVAPPANRIVVRTVLVIARVVGFPRALALQRAIEQIPGVVETKAAGFEHSVLNLHVQHDAMVNLAEEIAHLSGFPLTITNSSLGRLQLALEGR